jgi:hypothetical protein
MRVGMPRRAFGRFRQRATKCGRSVNTVPLVQLLNTRLAALGDIASPDEQREVTLTLLDRWQRRVNQEDGEFLTMILAPPSRITDTLSATFESRSLPYLSCLNTGFPDPKTRLPDGHPNELVNRSWADCFGRWLDAQGSSTFE